jgi:peptidoglycan/xylan/chitin deacetylase (PgdA/CDA1 family)
MEIGSHTVTHLDVRYGTNKEVELELRESKKVLEDILDTKVEHFCYPIGYSTEYALQTLTAAGYKTAVKTADGKADKTQGYLELRRIRIDYNDSNEGFLNKIN